MPFACFLKIPNVLPSVCCVCLDERKTLKIVCCRKYFSPYYIEFAAEHFSCHKCSSPSRTTVVKDPKVWVVFGECRVCVDQAKTLKIVALCFLCFPLSRKATVSPKNPREEQLGELLIVSLPSGWHPPTE